MSEDVNKDIQKATQDSQETDSSGGVTIPPPIIVKHGLDIKNVDSPEWAYREDEKNSK